MYKDWIISRLPKQIHSESPDKGCRRIRDDLARYYGAPVNDKRALHICRSLGIQSTIKYARRGCTRRASDPQYLAENVLNRQFYADKLKCTPCQGQKFYVLRRMG